MDFHKFTLYGISFYSPFNSPSRYLFLPNKDSNFDAAAFESNSTFTHIHDSLHIWLFLPIKAADFSPTGLPTYYYYHHRYATLSSSRHSTIEETFLHSQLQFFMPPKTIFPRNRILPSLTKNFIPELKHTCPNFKQYFSHNMHRLYIFHFRFLHCDFIRCLHNSLTSATSFCSLLLPRLLRLAFRCAHHSICCVNYDQSFKFTPHQS